MTHARAERRYRQPLCAGIHIAAPFAALGRGSQVANPSLTAMLAVAI